MRIFGGLAVIIIVSSLVLASGCLFFSEEKPVEFSVTPVGKTYTANGVNEATLTAVFNTTKKVSNVSVIVRNPFIKVKSVSFRNQNGLVIVRTVLKTDKSFRGSVPITFTFYDELGETVFASINADVNITIPKFGKVVVYTKLLNFPNGHDSVVLKFVPADGLEYKITSVGISSKPDWVLVTPEVKGYSVVLRLKMTGEPPSDTGLLRLNVVLLVSYGKNAKKFTLPAVYGYAITKSTEDDKVLLLYSFKYENPFQPGDVRVDDFPAFVYNVKKASEKVGDLFIVYASVDKPEGDASYYYVSPQISVGDFKSNEAIPFTDENLKEIVFSAYRSGIKDFYLIISAGYGSFSTTVEVSLTSSNENSNQTTVASKEITAFASGDEYVVYIDSTNYGNVCKISPGNGFTVKSVERVSDDYYAVTFLKNEGESGGLEFNVSCGNTVINFRASNVVHLTGKMMPTSGKIASIVEEFSKVGLRGLILTGNEERIKSIVPDNVIKGRMNLPHHYSVSPRVYVPHNPLNPKEISGKVFIPATNRTLNFSLTKAGVLLSPNGNLLDYYTGEEITIDDLPPLGDVVGYVTVTVANVVISERFVFDQKPFGSAPNGPEGGDFISLLFNIFMAKSTGEGYLTYGGDGENITIHAELVKVGNDVTVEDVNLSSPADVYKLMVFHNGVYLLTAFRENFPLGSVVLPEYWSGNFTDGGYSTDGDRIYRYSVSPSGLIVKPSEEGEPFVLPAIPRKEDFNGAVKEFNTTIEQITNEFEPEMSIELVSEKPYQVSSVIVCNGTGCERLQKKTYVPYSTGEPSYYYINFVKTVVLKVVLPEGVEKVEVIQSDGKSWEGNVSGCIDECKSLFGFDNSLTGAMNSFLTFKLL